MKPVRYALLALASLLAIPATATAAPDAVQECDSCHGPGGISAHGDVPTIAGQDAAFLLKTLRGYKRWDRPCIKSAYRYGDTSRPRTDMCEVAEGLSNEQMTALSDYYAALGFRPAPQEFDPALATAGAALHAEHCETCHEQGGKTAGREPRLAGQWMPYLRTSLKYVPTGEHLVPPMMEREITNFSAQEIDQLMHFYASQQD